MPTRIPASERTSQKLDELLTQGVADGDARTELLKLAVRKIVEEALEAEVAEAVGRGYYENGAAPAPATAMVIGGAGSDGGRRYRVRRPASGGPPGAVRLAGAGRAGGAHGGVGAPGGGDVRPRAEHPGHRSGVSRCEWGQTAESHRGEPGHRAAVAGVRSLRHPGPERILRCLPVCGWGGRAAARRAAAGGGAVCVGHHRRRPEGVAPPGAGTKEDPASCTAFFEDLKRRGLADPLLVVTDGAPGLIRAVETCFPRALRQRCLVHRLRNLQARRPTASGPRSPSAPRLLRGCVAGTGHVLRDDFSRPTSGNCPQWCLFPRRLRGLHRPSALSAPASQGDSHDQFARAAVARRAPADEDHPPRVRRTAGPEADVRGRDPRGRPVARDHRRRIRAAATAGDPRRAQPGAHDAHAPAVTPEPTRRAQTSS